MSGTKLAKVDDSMNKHLLSLEATPYFIAIIILSLVVSQACRTIHTRCQARTMLTDSTRGWMTGIILSNSSTNTQNTKHKAVGP